MDNFLRNSSWRERLFLVELLRTDVERGQADSTEFEWPESGATTRIPTGLQSPMLWRVISHLIINESNINVQVEALCLARARLEIDGWLLVYSRTTAPYIEQLLAVDSILRVVKNRRLMLKSGTTSEDIVAVFGHLWASA